MTQEQTIALIVAASPFLLSFAGVLFEWLAGKLPHNKQPLLMDLVETGVHAAEQVGAGQSGAAKKKIAEDFINASLVSLGLKINHALIDAAIEAVVFNLNQPQAVVQSVDSTGNNG
jgi:hypothetical protein